MRLKFAAAFLLLLSKRGLLLPITSKASKNSDAYPCLLLPSFCPMPKYILPTQIFYKRNKMPSICNQGLPIVFKNAKIIDIEYVFAAIFEKGQMSIFKTHKIPAQAQL